MKAAHVKAPVSPRAGASRRTSGFRRRTGRHDRSVDIPCNSAPLRCSSNRSADDRNIACRRHAVGRHREVQFHYTASRSWRRTRSTSPLSRRHEKNWVEAETRRVASAGRCLRRYRFQVAACNADGIWNETGASFAFSLAPHFHQTVWFYALCAVAASLAAWSLHRLRLRQARDEFALVLGERNRIARDLHDTLAQGFVGIAFQLEAVAAKLKEAPAQAQQHLDVALNMVRHSLSEARRSVMNLRSAALEKGDILNALGETARDDWATVAVIWSTGARAAAFHGRRKPPSGRPEAITNALKHSGAPNSNPPEPSPRSVCLSIHDNGKGFDSRYSRAPTALTSVCSECERAKQVVELLSIRAMAASEPRSLSKPDAATHQTP